MPPNLHTFCLISETSSLFSSVLYSRKSFQSSRLVSAPCPATQHFPPHHLPSVLTLDDAEYTEGKDIEHHFIQSSLDPNDGVTHRVGTSIA